MQRSLTINILCVYISSQLDQELNVHEFLLKNSKVQRSSLELITHIHVKIELFMKNQN